MLEKYGMSLCKPLLTPLEPSERLTVLDCPTTVEGKAEMAKYLYRPLIGSLMYMVTATRPDLAAAVGKLARFMSNPGMKHWQALLRILRYVQGTKTLGITYKKTTEVPVVTGYVDAYHAGCIDERVSTSGYIFLFADGAISWASRKQKTISTSSTEAEYTAACTSS
eukprot:TRINITY_DN990_c0_g3_i1.p2 TRINITY_DN990_c0_g3~~TRINITY_DN990_c0_g3_i1.p2  ORF type:complete len:166 (-),score=14.69 TRINITY_DN990_c0_g3_i1:418-915(-)